MDPDYFGIFKRLLGRPLRSSDIFYIIAGALYFVLGLLAVILEALNKWPSVAKWLSLLIAFVFVLVVITLLIRQSREQHKIIKKKSALSEAWALVARVHDEVREDPIWNYGIIDVSWEIDENAELHFTEILEVIIKEGILKLYQSSFSADPSADPLESFSESAFSVSMEGVSGPGVGLDYRINDLEARKKYWFVDFPAGLESGYPCKVITDFRWPGFWNSLYKRKRDSVNYVIDKNTTTLIQRVVFPSSVKEGNKIGFVVIPEVGDQELKIRDGRMELVWTVKNPARREYIIDFDLSGVL